MQVSTKYNLHFLLILFIQFYFLCVCECMSVYVCIEYRHVYVRHVKVRWQLSRVALATVRNLGHKLRSSGWHASASTYCHPARPQARSSKCEVQQSHEGWLCVTFMILRPAGSENAEVCKKQYIRKGKIFSLCRKKLKRPHNPRKKGILRKNKIRDKNNPWKFHWKKKTKGISTGCFDESSRKACLPINPSTSIWRCRHLKSGSVPFLCRTIWEIHSSINL